MKTYYSYKIERSNTDSDEVYEIKMNADWALSVLRNKKSSEEEKQDAIELLEGV
jgi:hypothetical protein